MELLRLILDEARVSLRLLGFMTVLAGLSTAAVLGVVNAAAQQAASDGASARLVVMFLCALGLFALSQRYVMSVSAREVETIIHRIRLRLSHDIRRADPETLAHLGRSPLFAALTQDTQTISRSLPLLVVGVQQAVMLVFVIGYMALLSLIACGLAVVFSVAAIAIHLHNMRALGRETEAVMARENLLFERLGDLFAGFKEVRMDRRRAEALAQALTETSEVVQDGKIGIKNRWAQKYMLIQIVYYGLLGVLVFAVPLFTEDYHEVVVNATTAGLFMIGPIGTVAQAIPAVADANGALRGIDMLRAYLGRTHGAGPDEEAEPLEGAIARIDLEDLTFTYSDAQGHPGFRIGPLGATFRAGEITFITGGNGSGKSTLLGMLTGLLPAQGGTIRVNGAPLRSEQLQAYRDQIAAVFSDYHLFRRLYGLTAVDPDRAADLLDRLEMTDKVAIRDNTFTTVDLSSGQRKRLALIAAILQDAPVLILDEWAADQDPGFRRLFYHTLLPDLRDRGVMVICVTHDDAYFPIADQILHMADGRILPAGASQPDFV